MVSPVVDTPSLFKSDLKVPTTSSVVDGDDVRLRICLHEIGGADGSNLDIQLQYSLEKTIWIDVGAQDATDKMFRWRDDEIGRAHV